MKNKLFICGILCCLLFAILPVFAKAESKVVDGGTWDGVTDSWTFFSDGTLKIDGNGTLRDSATGYPWAYYYDQVTRIVIGDNITYIPKNAFKSFYQLQNIEFGASVKTIGDGAFGLCLKLKSVTIPKTVETIGSGAFGSCENLETVNFFKNGALKSIGNNAFAQSALTRVEIPSKVKVGDRAFNNCFNLRTVLINDGAVLGGVQIFENCTQISYLHMGKNIGGNMVQFLSSKAIEYLQIDDYYQNIEFTRDQASLKMVVLRGDWDRIVGFENCPELTTFVFPESVRSIESGSFNDCPKLMQVDLPKNLVKMEHGVFNNTGLYRLVIPDSVTEIGSTSFSDNKNLRYVYCGSGLKSIQQNSFMNLPALETVDLCNVEKIYGSAFKNCGKLSNVMWSEKISMIFNWAFSECDSLKTVFLPAALNELGVGTFGNCDNLNTIVFRGDAPRFGYTNTFLNLNTTVFYPADNETWTEDVRTNYNGKLNWKPICTQHTPVAMAGRDANCCQCGLIEGSACQVCGWVITQQKIIETTKHVYEKKVIPASCTGGYTVYTCKSCGSSYVDDFVEANPHQMDWWHTPPQYANLSVIPEFRECANCDYYIYRDARTYSPPAVWPYFKPTTKPSVAPTTQSAGTVTTRPTVPERPTSTPPTTQPVSESTATPTSSSITTVSVAPTGNSGEEQQVDPLVEQDVKAIGIMLLVMALLCLTTLGVIIYIRLTKKEDSE